VEFQSIQFLFWVAVPALCALWAVRLWRLGLATRYPLLMAFLLGEILLDASGYLILRFGGVRGQLYAYFWPASRLVASTLFFLVLLDVFQHLVDGYAGLRKLSQMILYAALALAAAIVLGTTFLDPSTDLRSLWGFWAAEERSVYLALTAVSLVLLAFAAFFRLAPSHNVLVVFAVFNLIFIGQALLWTFQNFLFTLPSTQGFDFSEIRPLVAACWSLLCLLGGAILFSAAGERGRYLPPNWAGNQDSGIGRRIEELNRTLLNVFRL
jgi:hypothetical protein